MEMEADQRRRCLSRRDAMMALHWNEHANREMVHAYKTLHRATGFVEKKSRTMFSVRILFNHLPLVLYSY